MFIRIIKNEDTTFNDGFEIIAKRFGKEIGFLQINYISDCEYSIDSFRIKNDYRNKGIGRKMLNSAIKRLKELNVIKLSVYPYSDPYEGDPFMEDSLLYKIYKHLGFKTVSIKRELIVEGEPDCSDGKMILRLE